MNSDNPTRRNHFVPQFYLRRWGGGSDGRIWSYRRVHGGRIDGRALAAKQVAFRMDLYTESSAMRGLAVSRPDGVEKKLTNDVDTPAATILTKLIEQPDALLTSVERTQWCVFLVSLLERSPRSLERAAEHARARGAEVLATIGTLRDEAERARRDEILASLDLDALAKNAALGHLLRRLAPGEMAAQLATAWTWRVIDKPPELAMEFITSDCPLVINGGERGDDNIYMLSIALSPTRFFVAVTASLGDLLRDTEFARALMLTHNATVLRGAEYAFSRSEL